jgi:protein ImuB
MCVYLSSWPLQRLWHAHPALRDRPTAIAQPGTKRGAVIRWTCTRALKAGVRRGMPVAEARAILPSLTIRDEDPSSDLRALQKLASWAERYSPIVGLEDGAAPECLFLDVTGCASCFQGEDRLIERATSEFRKEGWRVRIAIADTLGAAWALAHYRESRPRSQGSGIRGQESEAASSLTPDSCSLTPDLLALPLTALRLPDEALATLAALGFERIADLLDIPRPGLATRVDPLVLRRLDQLLGRVPELIVPCKLPPLVQGRCSFEYATDRRAHLDHAIDQLLERITTTLREQQRGVKHLECWFYHESAPPSRLDVRLFHPTHALAHLRKLLDARLERLQFTEAVCGVCLRAPIVETMPERQYDLFDAEPAREEELAGLIDRLVSRLGRDAVTFATLVADPQPEYGCRFDPAIHEGRGKRGEGRGRKKNDRRMKKQGSLFTMEYSVLSAQYSVHSTQPSAPSNRPSYLGQPAALIPLKETAHGSLARFQHAGKEYAITRAWGPERIATGWWRGHDVQRDYYIVETDAGARWWIFRTREGRWFLHGSFE